MTTSRAAAARSGSRSRLLIDHVDEMIDYYGDDIEMENEDVGVLGGKGFTATIKRKGNVSLVVGSVQNGRVYRIHTTVSKDGDLEEAKRVHAELQKTFKVFR